MKRALKIILIISSLSGKLGSATAQGNFLKPRTIVTTDGEKDDQDSFIRLLMYSDDLQLEGLIYTSSVFHYAGDGKGTKFTSEIPWSAKKYGEITNLRWIGTDWMEKAIARYENVYDNLKKNDKSYPKPSYLKSIVKVGNIDFEGEMDKNTEGSDLIKKTLLDNKAGPVYLLMWGGTNTVARALKSIVEDYKDTPQWPSIYKKVSEKAILNIILDQDATYKKYVAVNWPDIKVLYNTAQFWSLAYDWPKLLPKDFLMYFQGKWFSENIKFNHGPLMSTYFLWGDGQKITADPDDVYSDTSDARKAGHAQYDFISEGDSPSFLTLIDVGLSTLEDPSFGGWGGRMVRSKSHPNRWEDGFTVSDFDPYKDRQDMVYPQTRWIPALQNDFAARANWCVKDFKNANHPPIVKLGTSENLSGKPGSIIKLKGIASDPDHDKLNYHWWQYKEAGTYNGDVEIKGVNNAQASFVIPKNAKTSETIHVILEVTDSGSPALTRYRAINITVK